MSRTVLVQQSAIIEYELVLEGKDEEESNEFLEKILGDTLDDILNFEYENATKPRVYTYTMVTDSATPNTGLVQEWSE